jgi:hypothetical protein
VGVPSRGADEDERFEGGKIVTEQLDDATRRAVDKIQKLLMLAARNPNEAEAALATAKAQELLVAYNLDAATVERENGVSGKRLDENVAGGMYKFQQKLWRHLAELNFCMYWTQRVRRKEIYMWRGRRIWTTFEHRLVGRAVNVVATKNMAQYVNQTVERLCRERVGDGPLTQIRSSYMVAFREGIVDRVCEKIAEKRRTLIKDEERRQADAARRASRAGVSLATTLTVAGLSEREEAANYDFLHGEGAWARKKEAEAEWERNWEKRRKARAKAEAEAERELAEWAAANPEEAAREAAKERARQRRKDSYVPRGRWRFRQTKEEMRRESGGYHAGYEAGEGVGIEPQVGGGDRRIGRG